MSKRSLLIDADILIFQHACTNQVRYEWDEDTVSEVVTPEEAIDEMEMFITNLRVVTETEETSPLFCFSKGRSFRYSVLPTYKHNRKDRERPILLETLRKHIIDNYDVRARNGLEADDIMGILGSKHPDKYILATLDKDLRQIPYVLNYNWRTGEMCSFNEEEANRYFFMQVLMGDPADGYKGCPGIGPKKAEKILEDVDVMNETEAWATVVETYVSKGLTEEDALQQARVARILRHTDYDARKREVILWSPKSL